MKLCSPKSVRLTSSSCGCGRPLPQLNRVIATTDFSDESEAGVRCALQLAEKFGAQTSLVHVVEPPMRIRKLDIVRHADKELEIASAKKHLKRLAKTHANDLKSVSCRVHVGRPAIEITAWAREWNADLIVIATHGFTGIDRFLIGSVAERVMRLAPCPVLTVRRSGVQTSPPETCTCKPNKILVPVDLSDGAEDALNWVRLLSGSRQIEVILLHVREQLPIAGLFTPGTCRPGKGPHAVVAPARDVDRDFKRIVKRFRRSPGLTVVSLITEGVTADEICSMGERLCVDMILLSTHGYFGVDRLLSRNTAAQVARSAISPVLTIRRNPQHEAPLIRPRYHSQARAPEPSPARNTTSGNCRTPLHTRHLTIRNRTGVRRADKKWQVIGNQWEASD